MSCKKNYLYSVEINDGEFIPVYQEDLQTKNGHHHWWYRLMVEGDDRPTKYRDKNGKTVHLNDILLMPNFDFEGVHYSWSVVVAAAPEQCSRFGMEKVVFKTIHIGWDYRVRPSLLDDERLALTAYADECICVGTLKNIVRPDGYLTEYEKTIKSPDGKNIC